MEGEKHEFQWLSEDFAADFRSGATVAEQLAAVNAQIASLEDSLRHKRQRQSELAQKFKEFCVFAGRMVES